ncbi:amidase [Qaidamihabitans albus]|uniref:amidase n=1 Tax=Qaidamihabitans albus TaxID=2795733 RepID=UPI0018F1C2CB|nr:amidase [Qaidamihabitans albus]
MRRTLLAALVVVTLAGLVSPAAAVRGNAPELGFALDEATMPDLQGRMARGELDAVALTRAYLARIRSIDGKVGAVLEVDRGAIAQARRSDLRRRTGTLRGPLDGIPVLLKDNIDTRAMATTAGSRALTGARPLRDAHLVRRLRAAGAVVLGKANLSEWANFRSTNATSGWSAVGGQTHNPHVLDRNPCGSSSGSAAAVAASLAQVAIGTETNGSIVCPAGATGVVGHKPSLGLVSRTGVVPISAEQDTAGPIARHVVDAAITLGVLQGRDPRDPATSAYPADQPTDYAAHLRLDALRGARIGVWRQAGLDPDVDRTMRSTVRLLREQGATVVDVSLDHQEEIGEHSLAALLSEFHRDIEAYLRTRPGAPRTLEELIEFNRDDPVELSKFGQELFEQALVAPGTDDPGYRRQRAAATELARRSLDDVIAAHDLDAIVSPTNGPAWRTSYGDGDDFLLGSSTPAAVAGYPNVTVPAGFAGPLPLGVSFMTARWQDARALGLAAAFERAADARRAPSYLPGSG